MHWKHEALAPRPQENPDIDNFEDSSQVNGLP